MSPESQQFLNVLKTKKRCPTLAIRNSCCYCQDKCYPLKPSYFQTFTLRAGIMSEFFLIKVYCKRKTPPTQKGLFPLFANGRLIRAPSEVL